MRRPLLIALSFLCLASAWADPPSARLEEGHAHLRVGDTESALTVYRDLLVDYPDSDVLHYNIGCAQYTDALRRLEHEDGPDALETLNEASTAFMQAQRSPDRGLRMRAGYNLANSKAQAAKFLAGSGQQEETITAFESSIVEYESFLSQFPKHASAKHNLDHMRYLLKRMLQQPPQEQDQQDQQQDDSEEDQEEGDEQQEQPQDGEAEDQAPSDSSEDEQQDQEQEEQQEEENQEESEDEQQAQQEESDGSNEEQDQQQQQEAEASESEMPDRQTIEAILESLEEQDQREQKEVRSAPLDQNMRPEWW
jgi:hypothetical protein